jgi:hypothetical protein
MGHLWLEVASGVEQSKKNSERVFDRTLHVPENYKSRSDWWVAVVVQPPQSSPYPPRSLSLNFMPKDNSFSSHEMTLLLVEDKVGHLTMI